MVRNCVISCIFGNEFTSVYPAPKGVDCFFFTNSKKNKREVVSKGWKYLFINFPLSDDIAVSSLQSKYVKYLQFRKQIRFFYFRKFEHIIYVDHKFKLEEQHVLELLKSINRPILLRKTPRLKDKIWDEVKAAKGQERYQRFMPQTIQYIKGKIRNGYSEQVRICNTGLMVYKTREEKIYKLVDEVYRDLINIGTSECQIVWALVSQKFADIIQTIEWDDLHIVWEVPRI